MSRPVEEKHTPLRVSLQWTRSRCLKRMRRECVLLLRGLGSRITKNLPSNLQKLRCKPVTVDKFSDTEMYDGLGDCEWYCRHCGALFWYGDRLKGRAYNGKAKYILRCGGGKIQSNALDNKKLGALRNKKETAPVVQLLLQSFDLLHMKKSLIFRDYAEACEVSFLDYFRYGGHGYEHMASIGYFESSSP
ncbi:hypothetical protein Tco_1041026 [Tanacetum coccineum]|uniref:Uncharacterized protein n=1 Tax=Tanacetum coccineum TaxID=301880 RepID=A0ABQ5GFP2_9ASTR